MTLCREGENKLHISNQESRYQSGAAKIDLKNWSSGSASTSIKADILAAFRPGLCVNTTHKLPRSEHLSKKKQQNKTQHISTNSLILTISTVVKG